MFEVVQYWYKNPQTNKNMVKYSNIYTYTYVCSSILTHVYIHICTPTHTPSNTTVHNKK